MDLFQLPTIVREPIASFRDQPTVTTEVFFRDIGQDQEAKARRAAQDLAWLLSLACLSDVQVSAFQYDGRYETFGLSGGTRFFRPVIDPMNREAIRGFIEQTWPRFRLLKRRRKLPEVIHYLVIADRPEQPIEVKLALIFIVMENLKATFARSAGIPYAGGAFRKLSIPPKRNIRREARYTFRELLDMMQQSVGMDRRVARIIQMRN